MIRRPPRSTLFPTRRSSDLAVPPWSTKRTARATPCSRGPEALAMHWRAGPLDTARSEEHTSELQSQSNLVCRLLLEKKKNMYTPSLADTCCRAPDIQL